MSRKWLSSLVLLFLFVPVALAQINIEQTFELEELSDFVVNSNNFQTVFSGSFELLLDANIYTSAIIPILSPSANRDSSCHITVDGVELDNSLSVRSLFSGDSANVFLMSSPQVFSSGNYTLAVECSASPPLSYTVSDSRVVLHELIGSNGTNLTFAVSNQSSLPLINGLLDSFNITTSSAVPDSGEVRSLVIEFQGAFNYNATNNISTILGIDSGNCSTVERFGSSGSVGSVGSSCVFSGLDPSTNYTVSLFGFGSGSFDDSVIVVKELISHTEEINSSMIVGGSINSSVFTPITSIFLEINDTHDTSNIYVSFTSSVYSNLGSGESMFFISVNGVNSSVVSRTVGFNELGVSGFHEVVFDVGGSQNITLWGSCDNSNCSLGSTDLSAYIVDVPTFMLFIDVPSLAFFELHDYFFDVTENEVLFVLPNSSGYDAVLTVDNSSFNMTDNGEFFTITLSSNDTGDTPFSVHVFNESNPLQDINLTGLFRWRDAFFVNVSLFETVEDTDGQMKTVSYGDSFDYVYAINKELFGDSYISDNPVIASLNQLPDFGADFSSLNFADTNYIFHWSEITGGEGQIKFYEPANYTLFLRKVEQKDSGVIDEFAKPSFSDSDIDTSKLAVLSLNGTNTTYTFLFNKLDVQKWEFYRNIFFYVVALVLWLVVVGAITFFTGDLRIAVGVGLGLGTFIIGGLGYFI